MSTTGSSGTTARTSRRTDSTPASRSRSWYYYNTYSHTSLNPGSSPTLAGAFNTKFPAFWAGDAQGYRLAALAQQDVDWARTQAAISQIETRSLFNQAMNTRNLDQLHFFSLLGAMAMTRRPQVILADGLAGGYVGLLAYNMTAMGVSVMIPTQPADTLFIPFVNGAFQPVQMPALAGQAAYTATKFRYVANSSLINFARIGINFGDLIAGKTLGAASFPDYTLQYFDEDQGVWADLTSDPLDIDWLDVQLRAFCPTCARQIGTQPAGLTALDVYDERGIQLASDRTAGHVSFQVPPGGETVGVHVLGGVDPCPGSCPPAWRHVDFKPVMIRAAQYSIEPNPVIGVSGTAITLTVHNAAQTTPATARYVWDFGDGKPPQQRDNDPTMQHQWDAGVYQVNVQVIDLATSKLVGRASATVQIDQALPIWRFTQVTETVSGNTSGIMDASRKTLNALIDDGGFIEPFTGAPFNGLLYLQLSAFTAGGQHFPPGVYLEQDSPPGLSFDPSRKFRALARQTQPPYVDAFIDDFTFDSPTAQGNLNQGTFGGHAISVVGDFTGFGGGRNTISHWQVSATKNGTQLTGTIFLFIERWEVDSSFGFTSYSGTLKYQFDFVAERVK